MNIHQVVEKIQDKEVKLSPALLNKLSCLERQDYQALFAVWEHLSIERRRTLMHLLVEIAADDFHVNFDPILRFGLQDGDTKVRITAIKGLWENQDPKLMHELLRLLETDSAVSVRAAAVTSLGRFILLGELERQGLSPKRCQVVYNALHTIIVNAQDDLQVQCRAVEVIAYVNTPEVSRVLANAYTHPEETMRISAIFGMGRSADPQWTQTVLGEMLNDNTEMRLKAAQACGELQDREAVPALAKLLDDENDTVRQTAIWALGQIGDKRARRLLERLCQQDDETIQTAAQESLEEMLFQSGDSDWLDSQVWEDDEMD